MEKEIKEAAEKVNGRLDSLDAKLQEIGSKIEEVNGEGVEGLKEEFKQLGEKHTEAMKEAKEFAEKQQEQLDEITMRQKAINPNRTETFKDSITKSLDDNKDSIGDFASGKRDAVSFNVKADMTVGADFTGDVIPTDRLAGIAFDPERRMRMRDILNVTTTTSDVIDHIQEQNYVDGASPTAEGAAASQTDFDLVEKKEPVQKINTFLTVSKEMLADTAFIENHIRVRGMSKLMSVEDVQILTGDGTGSNLNGIITQAPEYVDIFDGTPFDPQQLDIMIAAGAQVTFLEYIPTRTLLNPVDNRDIKLLKDAEKRYILPNPFDGQPINFEGAPTMKTTAIAADKFLIGDFSLGATFSIRQDIVIEMTNSHASNFTSGFVTILIEERVALTVHNPNAFVQGSFAKALAEGTA